MAKAKAEVRPIVLVVTQGGETREYELKQDSIIIGSGPTANVIIEDESVSSIHAIIKVTIEMATIIDLGSDTGTQVNGVEAREARLKDGDRLKLGDVEVQVQLPRVAADAPPSDKTTVMPQKPAEDRTVNLAKPDNEVTGTDTVAVELRSPAPKPAPMPRAKSKAVEPIFNHETKEAPRPKAPEAMPRAKSKAAPAPLPPPVAEVSTAPETLAEPAAAPRAPKPKAPAPQKRAPRPVAKPQPRSEAPAQEAAKPRAKTNPVTQPSTDNAKQRTDTTDLPELQGRLAGVKVSASGIPLALLDQALPRSERGSTTARTLQIGLFWGTELLDAKHVQDGTLVTIGESPKNTFCIAMDGMPASMPFVQADGLIVIPDGISVDAKLGKERVDREVLKARGRLKPAQGPLMSSGIRLGLDERLAVRFGSVTLVLQYVAPAGTFLTPWAERVDQAFVSTALFVGIFALFLMMMVVVAPKGENEAADDLFKNSQRFARLMLKEEQKKPKQAFELAGRKGGAKTKDEQGKPGKKDKPQQDAAASKNGAPRVDQREKDRKVAMSSGLLRALSGKQSAVSNIFGPEGLGTGVNAALGGLKSANTGDAGGLAGLGSRGAAPGAGGASVGIGGIGTNKTVGNGGLGNVDLGGRGRSERSVEAGKTTVTGGLSQEAIKRVLDRAQSQLRYCYEKELQRVPDLNGKVTVKFTIGGTGGVNDASVGMTTLQNANAEECMLRVFKRLRFPSPAGGGVVDVSYPMIYKPLGE